MCENVNMKEEEGGDDTGERLCIHFEGMKVKRRLSNECNKYISTVSKVYWYAIDKGISGGTSDKGIVFRIE